MSNEDPKRQVFEQFAAVAKALGHPNRLELLEFLAQGESSVETLAQRAGLNIGNASQHLQHLRRAGVVVNRREGKHIFYALSDDSVIDLLRSLRHVAEKNIAAVQQVRDGYFHDLDALEPVTHEELQARMNDGGTTLLDVRPREEFSAGHLPGAINAPLSELDHVLAGLPKDNEIVAYCRGPYCIFSFEAVAHLRQRGFNVRRLEDGYPEWKAAGLPVERLSA